MSLAADASGDRLVRDRFLRWHDWRIHSRPRTGPALWRRGALVRTADAAIALVLAEIRRAEEGEQIERAE